MHLFAIEQLLFNIYRCILKHIISGTSPHDFRLMDYANAPWWQRLVIAILLVRYKKICSACSAGATGALSKLEHLYKPDRCRRKLRQESIPDLHVPVST